MPRDLPIGNGSLLIDFDHICRIRDIYRPHVGQENHTNGRVFRLGVWVNGQFSWLESKDWQRELTYSKDSLVTESILENTKPGINLRFRDAVDLYENLLIHQCSVENHTDQEQEIKK